MFEDVAIVIKMNSSHAIFDMVITGYLADSVVPTPIVLYIDSS